MSDSKASKYLSYVLRHKPESIGIDMDEFGWVRISDLVNMSDSTLGLTANKIRKIVENSKKTRFRIDESGELIKANQGHSIEIFNDFIELEPPVFLYHGTAERNILKILETGILKMQRHHVHMTENIEAAKEVGQRYGKPIVWKINSKKMFENGMAFYKSINNVWLTDCVPPEFIEQFHEKR